MFVRNGFRFGVTHEGNVFVQAILPGGHQVLASAEFHPDAFLEIAAEVAGLVGLHHDAKKHKAKAALPPPVIVPPAPVNLQGCHHGIGSSDGTCQHPPMPDEKTISGGPVATPDAHLAAKKSKAKKR